MCLRLSGCSARHLVTLRSSRMVGRTHPDCCPHEVIHIQRRDWLTQLIAQFAACVYWFHPLAWIALKQMLKGARDRL